MEEIDKPTTRNETLGDSNGDTTRDSPARDARPRDGRDTNALPWFVYTFTETDEHGAEEVKAEIFVKEGFQATFFDSLPDFCAAWETEEGKRSGETSHGAASRDARKEET